MKRILVLFLVIGGLLVSCKDGKKKGNVQDLADGTYIVNVKKSVVKWKGFKPTGSHNGTLAIDYGSLKVEGGKVVGGDFHIDMESMKVLDIPADDEYNAKLLNHLKNADFFDVPNHKTASFKITKVEGEKVEGMLTIKGVSKPIKFDASIEKKENMLFFTSEKVTFDRTDYGIKYKSKKFFESLKDKFINDEVEVSFDVKATKQ